MKRERKRNQAKEQEKNEGRLGKRTYLNAWNRLENGFYPNPCQARGGIKRIFVWRDLPCLLVMNCEIAGT